MRDWLAQWWLVLVIVLLDCFVAIEVHYKTGVLPNSFTGTGSPSQTNVEPAESLDSGNRVFYQTNAWRLTVLTVLNDHGDEWLRIANRSLRMDGQFDWHATNVIITTRVKPVIGVSNTPVWFITFEP